MKNDQGEDVSTLEIKKFFRISLKKKIRKTTTRRSTCGIVKRKGYPIARRTIAKYREQLDIPVARMRRRYSFKPLSKF
jgi:RNA polymerase sigma-54 factor